MCRAAAYLFAAVVAGAGCGANHAVPTAQLDFGGPVDGGAEVDSGPTPVDAAASDLRSVAADGGAAPECQWGGAPGKCMSASACAATADHSAEPGSCAGGATIQCCIDTPDVADNPPTPAGYKPMAQSQVTPAMTTWAVKILHDPVTYPMYSTTTQSFGTLLVLARVEWHPPDFQNGAVHRGVTLYVPI